MVDGVLAATGAGTGRGAGDTTVAVDGVLNTMEVTRAMAVLLVNLLKWKTQDGACLEKSGFFYLYTLQQSDSAWYRPKIENNRIMTMINPLGTPLDNTPTWAYFLVVCLAWVDHVMCEQKAVFVMLKPVL